MLTDKEVKHIATLARIALTEQEEEHFKKDLSSILGYVDTLGQVPTDNVEPLYQVTGITNAARSDEPRQEFVMNEELRQTLIEQAPAHDKDYIKVKAVLKAK
jgi:aspartyl-tRNA(Asn)/glutamyl-tRNA(Gln) amidotransferase subunit C